MSLFTIVLALVLAFLCAQGIHVVVYLEYLLRAVLPVPDQVLESFTRILNLNKSSLNPSHRLEYIALTLDTALPWIFLLCVVDSHPALELGKPFPQSWKVFMIDASLAGRKS